jgi:hypothetical protein
MRPLYIDGGKDEEFLGRANLSNSAIDTIIRKTGDAS